MILEDLVKDLERLSDDMTIYVARKEAWTPQSQAEALPTNQTTASKLPYFLEVHVAKKVIKGWSFARNGRVPSLSQRCEALIFYAENDAYILPEHERGE